MIDDAFGHWLAGFIDGEGCFIIRQMNRNEIYCSFSISLRDDDAAIIEEIRSRLGGIGILKFRHRKGRNGNDCPQVEWVLQSGQDCAVLVRVLDKYQLRAKK